MTEIARYVSRAGEAGLLGVQPSSVTRYRIRYSDYPPAVECPCCGSAVRERVAVQAWAESRPGQGAGGGRPKKTRSGR